MAIASCGLARVGRSRAGLSTQGEVLLFSTSTTTSHTQDICVRSGQPDDYKQANFEIGEEHRSLRLHSDFIQEFSYLLSVIMLQYDRVPILGDFNIHICRPSSSLFTSDFMKLLDSFSLTQYVKQPSNDKGHTLDSPMGSVWMR